MQVSFLIPVYNTDPAVLTLCVNSVLKAAADHHQVVVADDASSNPETPVSYTHLRAHETLR